MKRIAIFRIDAKATKVRAGIGLDRDRNAGAVSRDASAVNALPGSWMKT